MGHSYSTLQSSLTMYQMLKNQMFVRDDFHFYCPFDIIIYAVQVVCELLCTNLHEDRVSIFTTYTYKHQENQMGINGVKILAVDPRCFKQGVREAIHIRMEQRSRIKDGGHFNLHSICTNRLRS